MRNCFKEFKLGEIIYGELGYGFSESGRFAIKEIKENGYLVLVEVGGWKRETYTDGGFVRPISRKFGIGYYYEDRKAPEILSKEDIEKACKEAEEERLRQEEEERIRKFNDEKEQMILKIQYPYLLRKDLKGWLKGSEVSKNLRMMIKNELPEVKGVKVNLSGGDAIYVYCKEEDLDKVRPIAYRFQDHATDYSGDYMDYCPSNFNRVFGGVKYVFCQVNR